MLAGHGAPRTKYGRRATGIGRPALLVVVLTGVTVPDG
jgi:hypothetical protein